MENEKPKLFFCAHAFADPSPLKLLQLVEKFSEGKTDVNAVFNSTPVMIPGHNSQIIGGMAQVQMQIICTAFVTWWDTKENFEKFTVQNKIQKIS